MTAVKPIPQIHVPREGLAVQRGASWSYQIDASRAPFFYEARGLPTGLSLNNTTGLISGVVDANVTPGTHVVYLTASNYVGSGSEILALHTGTLSIVGYILCGVSLGGTLTHVVAPTVLAFAANTSGLTSALLSTGWNARTPIAGKTINCASWSGTAWYAVCTDGTVHKSPDGVTWSLLTTTVSVPNRIVALDDVVVVGNFLIGVKVSLDAGATWANHTPYAGSPNAHNAQHIRNLGGGVYRIFDGGQSGGGGTSGILVSADTNAMPSPGSPWTVRFSGASGTVYDIRDGASGLVAASSTPAGKAAVLASTDGTTWAMTDTGVASANGRSVLYSTTHNLYFIGTSIGSVLTSANLSAFAVALTGFGGAVDSFTVVSGITYCGANGGGCWSITPASKTLEVTGAIQFVSGYRP
jgi:hypothetical protein